MCAFSFDVRKTARNYLPENEERTTLTATAKRAFGQIPRNRSVDALNQTQDVRLRKLLQLIESDPLGDTQDWALAFNLSHSHLQYLFKQATGMALGQVLTEKRLQRAAQLLAKTNMSIKEIACAVGYEHSSSFSRAFEKRFEQAPRRYRMQNSA
jgi:AraC-like DNA-binding protein